MLSVLSEVHFWTLKDEVHIPNTDFGSFRYYDKKSCEDSVYFEGKKSYAEKRGQVWMPQNKRPVKLKENLKELEDHLLQQRVILCQWKDSDLLQLMFSSGLFVKIFVNIFTGDVMNITFDKFLVGKLLSDYVADVVLTKSHLICSYNDNQLTLVYFTKPALKRNNLKSLSNLDPRICTVYLVGPVGRRLEKRLACNVSGDMVVAWWICSSNEVYPWSPVVKDQDRANILVYGISGTRAELLCHHRSEFELISVCFSNVHSNVIRSVEQKISRNGDVSVESCSYEISRGSINRTSVTSISLPTHVCCHAFSPAQDKLLLGCIDGSIVLFDGGCGVSVVVKATFTPSLMTWHPDGGAVMLANERGQLQLLDAALATLRLQLLCEDVMSSTIMDLSSYFRSQPTLSLFQWNKKPDSFFYGEKYVVADSLLLLLFEGGPVAAIRVVGGGGLSKDIHGSRALSFDSLVAQYLWVNQIDRAISLLLALNWDIYGSTCLLCLQRIVNHLFRRPLTPDREAQLQTALGSFHMPARPMCPATVEEFKLPVRDLTRRFFHQLLRFQLFEKAFRLAIDLMDYDLFMDIHFSAKQAGEPDIAEAAYNKAKDIDSHLSASASGSSFSGSSHSLCSRSSCSECSETASAESSEEDVVSGFLSGLSDKSESSRESARTIDTSYVHTGVTKNIHPPLPVVKKLLPRNDEESRLLLEGRKLFHSFSNSPIPASGTSMPPDRGCSSHELMFKDHDGSLSTFSHTERPKVKFSETVTQITLHDRLHTLPEEEEEHPPVTTFPSSSTHSYSNYDIPLNSSAPKAHSFSSFSDSVNSLGIPTGTIMYSAASNPARKVSEKDNLRAYPTSNKIFSPYPLLSRTTMVLSDKMDSKAGTRIHTNVSDTLPSSVSPLLPSSSCPQTHPSSSKPFVCQKVIEEVKQGLKQNLNLNGNIAPTPEQGDLLGTEELLKLLPGSRKAVVSRSPEALMYKKESHSSQIADEPYYINYSGVLHDLSEEEENNGTIKIVHFGVV